MLVSVGPTLCRHQVGVAQSVAIETESSCNGEQCVKMCSLALMGALQ